jgi:hypothetical protein
MSCAKDSRRQTADLQIKRELCCVATALQCCVVVSNVIRRFFSQDANIAENKSRRSRESWHLLSWGHEAALCATSDPLCDSFIREYHEAVSGLNVQRVLDFRNTSEVGPVSAGCVVANVRNFLRSDRDGRRGSGRDDVATTCTVSVRAVQQQKADSASRGRNNSADVVTEGSFLRPIAGCLLGGLEEDDGLSTYHECLRAQPDCFACLQCSSLHKNYSRCEADGPFPRITGQSTDATIPRGYAESGSGVTGENSSGREQISGCVHSGTMQGIYEQRSCPESFARCQGGDGDGQSAGIEVSGEHRLEEARRGTHFQVPTGLSRAVAAVEDALGGARARCGVEARRGCGMHDGRRRLGSAREGCVSTDCLDVVPTSGRPVAEAGGKRDLMELDDEVCWPALLSSVWLSYIAQKNKPGTPNSMIFLRPRKTDTILLDPVGRQQQN